MSRLSIKPLDTSNGFMDDLVDSFARRIVATPPSICSVGALLGFLQASKAQTCGKCTSCSKGIPLLEQSLQKVVAFTADAKELDNIKDAAILMRDTADCAVGYQIGAILLEGVDACFDEFAWHIERGMCDPQARQSVPCMKLCPAHVNIPAYIALAEEGKCADAIKMIRRDNPFPTACALICEHPCEDRCRRTIIDAPINIRGIKKYVVDTVAADIVETPTPAPKTGKRVAVVGGGPSGLTCAYFLALMGHEVTVFEERKQLGGMMRYGIPAYRFPRERLDEDIRAILNAGAINVETEHAVDADEIARLTVSYDAIYVAIGAQGGKGLSLQNEEAEGVISAVELLGRIGDEDYPNFSGKDIVVIGGGNVAMDCARTSVRAGAKSVTIAYRRRLEDMTALPSEVEAAIAEGVEMMCLQAPERIELDASNKVKALITQPQRIGAVKGGRPAPVAANKPEVEIQADIVLVAVGQSVESAPFEGTGVVFEHGRVKADEDLSIANLEGVYAGGDCQSGPKTVIMAIAAGKAAAANIDERLGFHHTIDCGAITPPAHPNNKIAYGRVQIAERPARERKHDFAPVEVLMSDEEAVQECGRCLRCDVYGVGALTGKELERW